MKEETGRTRKALRVLRRGPILVAYVVLCFLDCLLRTSLGRLNPELRSQRLQHWSARILLVMGVRVSVLGPIPVPGLIAANHLSYLDILVFSAAAPCAFVSKSEVKWWPLVGWVAAMTGTVFVDRRSRGQTQSVRPLMGKRLQEGMRLLLFPEATSSDGCGLLPFHSSLFQAAVEVAAPITAAWISYDLPLGEGDPAVDVCYWGDMVMLPHLLKLLTKTRVCATIRFAGNASSFSNRKEAAQNLRRQVEELALTARGAAPQTQQEVAPGS